MATTATLAEPSVDSPDSAAAYTSDRTCVYCEEFSSGGMPAELHRASGIRERLRVFGDEVVFPTVSPLMVGHTLISPNHHVGSIAQVADKSALIETTERTIAGLRLKNGEYAIFEHGVGTGKTGGCGIDHAHVHVLPLSSASAAKCLSRIREDHRGRATVVTDYWSAVGSRDRTDTYLVFWHSTEGGVAAVSDAIQSQYLRRVVAASVGMSDWDWRHLTNWTSFRSTHRLLQAL